MSTNRILALVETSLKLLSQAKVAADEADLLRVAIGAPQKRDSSPAKALSAYVDFRLKDVDLGHKAAMEKVFPPKERTMHNTDTVVRSGEVIWRVTMKQVTSKAAKTELCYFYVTAKAKNGSKKELSVTDQPLRLDTADGREYFPSEESSLSTKSKRLRPSIEEEFTYYFEVPRDYGSLTIQIARQDGTKDPTGKKFDSAPIWPPRGN